MNIRYRVTLSDEERWMFTIERARQKLGASYPSPGQRPVQAAA